MSSNSFYDDFDGEEYTGEEDFLMQIFMGIDELRVLYSHVCYAIETWPGSPARPAEEQVKMQHMKLFLFSIMCEASLDLWAKTLKVAATLSELLKKLIKDKENIHVQITGEKNSVDKVNNI